MLPSLDCARQAQAISAQYAAFFCGALDLLAEVCSLVQLLVRQWDKRVSRDILAHWLDLLSKDGWIAREQVRSNHVPSYDTPVDWHYAQHSKAL